MSWVIVGSKHGMTGFDPLQTAVAGLLADHRCGVKGEERVRCSMQGAKLLLLCIANDILPRRFWVKLSSVLPRNQALLANFL